MWFNKMSTLTTQFLSLVIESNLILIFAHVQNAVCFYEVVATKPAGEPVGK